MIFITMSVFLLSRLMTFWKTTLILLVVSLVFHPPVIVTTTFIERHYFIQSHLDFLDHLLTHAIPQMPASLTNYIILYIPLRLQFLLC